MARRKGSGSGRSQCPHLWHGSSPHLALQTPFRSLAGTKVLLSTLQHVTCAFWQLWRLARGFLQPWKSKIWSFMATSDACSPVGYCKQDCIDQGLNAPSGNLTVGNLQGWLTASMRAPCKHLHLLRGESLLLIECCHHDQQRETWRKPGHPTQVPNKCTAA